MARTLAILGIALAATLPQTARAQTADPYGVLNRVQSAAAAMGADPDAMTAVVLCEDSALEPDPIGAHGERGPFQIQPATSWAQAPEPWRDAGPDDLDANIAAGIAMHLAGLGYLWTCQ